MPDSNDIVDPVYYYQHKTKRGGGAITRSAFVPEGLWPSDYKFLFIDFVFLEIYNLIRDNSKERRGCIPPTPGFRNETFYVSHEDPNRNENYARMVDVFFGPYKDTQALYLFKYGNGENIQRIRYVGAGTNRPPVADIGIEDQVVRFGEEVIFDGSGSYDEDGDSLTFQWDFGDGSTSSEESPSHSYSSSGLYTVTLVVRDEKDQERQTITIEIGGPPTASITSPSGGSQFYSGQILRLFGEATDSRGNVLDSSQIE